MFYTDDFILICPSRAGLQKLINICSHQGDKLNILFNVQKTVAMISKSKRDGKFIFNAIYLNNVPLEYCEQYKYLGHIITNALSDDEDITRQTLQIYAIGNMLINKFALCTPEVKCVIFKTYISNFYSAQLWCTYSQSCYQKFRVAYNNIFRRFFNLDRRCSVSYELTTRNIPTCENVIRRYMYSCMCRLRSNQNMYINALLNSNVMINSKVVKK